MTLFSGPAIEGGPTSLRGGPLLTMDSPPALVPMRTLKLLAPPSGTRLADSGLTAGEILALDRIARNNYMRPVSLTGEVLPPQRDERGHYLPGNSGNPGGLSEAKREVQEVARRHSVEAIERAVEIMRTCKSETIRLMAISMILDRARGKPKQEIDVTNEGQSLEQMLTAIWKAKHAGEAEQEAAKKPDGA